MNILHKKISRQFISALAFACACVAAATPAYAEPDAATKEALAKASQNPVADMISLPLQNNLNGGIGPDYQKQDVLNIQPVYPIELNSDWNLITRTILPVISQPSLGTRNPVTYGLGDLQFSEFLSPSNSQGWIWGAGTVLQVPTGSEPVLGQGKWGLGPTAVALHLDKGSPWVYGALVNNVTSVAGQSDRQRVNQMLVQPFINYNFRSHPGLALSFSPIITANWEATGSNQWTVPLGLGVSQILFIGNQAVSVQIAGYSNVVRPDYAPIWTARLQFTFLFPKSKTN